MTQPRVDEYLTVDELAAELRLPKRTIYYWRQNRTGPPSYKLGRQIRYLRSEVSEWLATQRTS